LSTHLLLGLPSRLFPSDLPTTILYAFIFGPTRATCPTYLILLEPRVVFNKHSRTADNRLSYS
jgi:hypothetical protein